MSDVRPNDLSEWAVLHLFVGREDVQYPQKHEIDSRSASAAMSLVVHARALACMKQCYCIGSLKTFDKILLPVGYNLSIRMITAG